MGLHLSRMMCVRAYRVKLKSSSKLTCAFVNQRCVYANCFIMEIPVYTALYIYCTLHSNHGPHHTNVAYPLLPLKFCTLHSHRYSHRYSHRNSHRRNPHHNRATSRVCSLLHRYRLSTYILDVAQTLLHFLFFSVKDFC